MSLEDKTKAENKERFSEKDKEYLRENRIDISTAERYNPKFTAHIIEYFCNKGITPEMAECYDTFTNRNIMIMRSVNMPYIRCPEKRERIRRLFSEIIPEKSSFGLTGASGGNLIVFSSEERTAWKINLKAVREYNLLKRVQDFHKGAQNHVVKLKGELKEDIAFQIEFFDIGSIYDILEVGNIFSSEEVISISNGIIKGLIELREAGIEYHNDIQPKNLVIDEEDRAVIIDLGYATLKGEQRPVCNRAYGIDDLVALGQIMYEMATGKHLFLGRSVTNWTDESKDQAQSIRERVYSKPEKELSPFFDKVDERIKDKRINSAIKTLLSGKDYEAKLWYMIEMYVNELR